MEKPFSRDPAALIYGAVVGAWRVVGWAGQGSYGVVYCVQRVDDPGAGFFALKIALEPEDERLLREAELLACLERVHRDVKGSNVLVTEEGRAVLTDFGLGTYRGASVLTRQAEPLGMARYLSPQALLHREKCGGSRCMEA